MHESYFVFKNAAIQYHEVLEQLGTATHGAQACFFGAIRDHNQGKRVVSVSYEIHRPLAGKSLQDISKTVKSTWGEDLRICIIHAEANLQVGELAVGIGVSSAHRDEAFQACRFIIEEIKHKVPIWKKEYYTDGESDWVQGHALCAHASG